MDLSVTNQIAVLLQAFSNIELDIVKVINRIMGNFCYVGGGAWYNGN